MAFSLGPLEVDVTPEPTPEERAALLAALGSISDPGAASYRSDWRLAGVLENVESDAAVSRPAFDGVSPRSKPGASRA